MTMSAANQTQNNQVKPDDATSENPSLLQKVSNVITGTLEKGFYRLGNLVGENPWLVILICLLVSVACMTGFLKFERESRAEELWIPPEAQALGDKVWVDETFPAQSGFASFIAQDANVLTSKIVNKILKIHKEIVKLTIKYENRTISWDEFCFKKGGTCSLASLLELWAFDEERIQNLTDEQILKDVNGRPDRSPYSGSPFSLHRVVGDLVYSNGSIIGARVLKVTYFYEAQLELQKSNGQLIDERADMWLKEYDKVMEKYGLIYLSRTKFRETSQEAISGDIILLTSGYLLIFIYIMAMLGKFTRLEIKIWIALGGILSVGLSVAVSMALCSAMGFFYGPAHTTLPFLLLGIGVDDLFVIVQSWYNIPANIHQHNKVGERIGLALKHAGSSITITTATDLLAFLVGGTTIIPGLKSFCFYAAIGILCDYILQITFFVSWLAIDARRTDNRRDGCCCCIKLSSDYTPNKCGEKSYLQTFFDKVFSKMILKPPVKVLVAAVTLGLLAVNIYGTTQLRQQFEPKWFLPPGTIVREYFDLDDEKFPESGFPIGIYTGSIDYYSEQEQLHKLHTVLQNEHRYLSNNSVSNWYEHFIIWAQVTVPQHVNSTTQTLRPKDKFYEQLKIFLNSAAGKRFFQDVKWTKTGDTIEATRVSAFMKTITETQDQVAAMDTLREKTANAGLSQEPRVYNRVILFAESHKVIREELYRNILLALAVVFIVTFVVIASPFTSFFIFLCVLCTIVDVGGLVYFWGLTIDTISVVILIIAVGLSVDYASHIGHTFLVKSGTRSERTVKMYRDIGPAVWNGGFSTFLAILPLATSQSHVFTTFFRILFGVVLFGVFHGLVFLPTMLSVVGPSPYPSAKKMESSSNEAETGGVTNNGSIPSVACHSNEMIETQDGVSPPNPTTEVANNHRSNPPALSRSNEVVEMENEDRLSPPTMTTEVVSNGATLPVSTYVANGMVELQDSAVPSCNNNEELAMGRKGLQTIVDADGTSTESTNPTIVEMRL